MAFRVLVGVAVLLLGTCSSMAYSHTQLQAHTERPLDSTLLPRSKEVVPSPLNTTTTTNAIFCWREGETTTVPGCRDTLNYLRTFPNYRFLQDFQENRVPKLPSKPPLLIYAKSSTCAVELRSGDPSVVDQFSFEMVRALATDIVEECQDEGGFGGQAPIGRGLGWKVSFIGYRYVLGLGNGTVGVGDMNATGEEVLGSVSFE
ncbi:hypothetical protein MMC28_009732 [Mycoblastus sanguinarius]|nr:hypothetical protein [Mycoblastus sanguinarius]